jgi:hypothetical protein
MDIQGLGYVGVRASRWRTGRLGTRFLGMQLVDGAKSLALRMDDRRQRVVVSEDGGEGVGFFGWEVKDAATLNAFAARLEKAGVQVARGTRARRRAAGEGADRARRSARQQISDLP